MSGSEGAGSLGTRLNAALEKRLQNAPPEPGAATPYDWHEPESPARAIGEAHTSTLTERRFPCRSCGAMLDYRIGTHSLECRYCGHLNEIDRSTDRIVELDLGAALEHLQRAGPMQGDRHVTSCPNCAAEFTLDDHVHTGECPFCGTTVVVGTGDAKPIKPQGILPFAVTAATARESYRKWLDGLWFAPSALKEHARGDTSLEGVYVPYWTYDSDTATAYAGQRGDVYYVTQRYTTTVNGRRVTRTRQVPKIRWSPASGRTSRHFDDVLVGATRTLPRKITDWLSPWDLENLEPYTEDYLAGFSSEIYQVDLDEGFDVAQQVMDATIRGDVRRAIGGDQQRITSLRTRHSDTTFKHVLLPLWSAGFRFRDKTYRFVVNGRSGKVRGERPWSVVKIALAAIAGALVLATLLVLAQGAGAFSGSGGGFGGGFGTGLGGGGITIDWGGDVSPSRWPDTPLGGGYR